MSANDDRKIPPGCENGDALEFVQFDEIAITRNQEIGFAGVGGIEKFVVFRVSTDMNKASRGNNFTVAHEDGGGSFAGFGEN